MENSTMAQPLPVVTKYPVFERRWLQRRVVRLPVGHNTRQLGQRRKYSFYGVEEHRSTQNRDWMCGMEQIPEVDFLLKRGCERRLKENIRKKWIVRTSTVRIGSMKQMDML